MMSSRTLLKGAAIGTFDPGEALREVNELLYEENETMMFVTVLYSIYDPASAASLLTRTEDTTRRCSYDPTEAQSCSPLPAALR